MASIPTEAMQLDIHRLTGELNSLHSGEAAVLRILACGPAAIGPLKEFLFLGKPSNVCQPRQWAVEALARLGARDVLIAYLKWKKNIPDPAVRAGEEAVENAAAAELAATPGDDVLSLFLDLARTRPLPAVLEALGNFGAAAAIPCMIRGLEDDSLRPAAEESLQKMSLESRPELLKASLQVSPDAEHESPSSHLRRLSALNILADIGISPGQWATLHPLLGDPDLRIIVAVSRIALGTADAAEDRSQIVRRLFDELDAADWKLQDDIEHLLVKLFCEARPLLEREIERRWRLIEKGGGLDPILLTLLRVRRRAEIAHVDCG